MSLIVAKFGGTSVASPERIQMVAKKVIAKKQAGHDAVSYTHLDVYKRQGFWNA